MNGDEAEHVIKARRLLAPGARLQERSMQKFGLLNEFVGLRNYCRPQPRKLLSPSGRKSIKNRRRKIPLGTPQGRRLLVLDNVQGGAMLPEHGE